LILHYTTEFIIAAILAYTIVQYRKRVHDSYCVHVYRAADIQWMIAQRIYKPWTHIYSLDTVCECSTRSA